MSITKFLLISFVVCIVVVAIAFAGVAFYVAFFGKGTIEQMISKALGSQVKFQGMSFNLNKGLVNFTGFTVLNKIEFEENIFKADKFVVSINKERFEKDKTLIMEEIFIEKGVLTIERNRAGTFNIASIGDEESPWHEAVAYAAETASNIRLYDFVSTCKKITITDSTLNFKDYHISRQPFFFFFDNMNLEFSSSPVRPGNVGANCRLNMRVPMQSGRHGSVSLQLAMSIYPERADMEGNLSTKDINLMLFNAYFDRYTPFSFNNGLFNSTTQFRMHNNIIDSPTTMVFRGLKLYIKPGMEKAQFLQTAVNKLAPYLMSQQGDLYFDFVIKGPVEKPQAGLGPKVKFAIGMVALEELSKAMQQLQQLQQALKK
jgi:hypothetical protein